MMKFHPRLAPIKAAIFPLVNKDGMPEMAEKLYRELKPHFNVFYDEKGAIGRRYRRQDEAGTPFCITVDGQTLQRRHRHDPRPRFTEAGESASVGSASGDREGPGAGKRAIVPSSKFQVPRTVGRWFPTWNVEPGT